MSNARYSNEYMQSVYDRITTLEKDVERHVIVRKRDAAKIDRLEHHALNLTEENDNLRVAMKSMASMDTVRDLHNTIDTLSRSTELDTKAKVDLLSRIHTLEDKYDVVVESLRACKVDKEHMQNTIRDLDKAAAEPWVYTTKVRKLNADLEDKVKDLETTMFVHSCKSDDVATLEKDRAALDTLNRMLLKNNKALRARLNNLEGPGYADAIKQIVSGVKYFADNYKGE